MNRMKIDNKWSQSEDMNNNNQLSVNGNIPQINQIESSARLNQAYFNRTVPYHIPISP
jgi:hypothetical protein